MIVNNFFSEANIFVLFLFTFLSGFIITFISIPTVLRMSRFKNLFDEVDDRKVHTTNIPRLGGMGIFAGLTISILLSSNLYQMSYLGAFISSLLILFFIGIKDDILVIAPLTKFIGQILAALVIVLFGDVMITNLHGFFGVFELPYWISIFLTVFVFLVTTNAFNFIDGVDGLSSGIGLLTATIFGFWFFLVKDYQSVIVSLAIIASLAAFLRYNLFSKKDKIFMGDTGSMIVGFIISFLAIQFCENNLNLKSENYHILPAPAVAFGILIVPYFDMMRVMLIRKIRGKKVFYPDKNHMHHLLLDLGFSHKKIVLILGLFTVLFSIFIFYISQFVSIRRLLLLELIVALIFFLIPEFFSKRKNK